MSAMVRRWWTGELVTHHGGDAPGVRGNRHLTAEAGLILIPLLAVVYGTGALFGSMWRAHYFIGFLLTAPLLLKLASTGWRMARYYTRAPRYREAGPPAPLLRLTAPVLVAATVITMVTGVVMWARASQDQPWSSWHTDASVILLLLLGLHLAAYLPLAVREARRDAARWLRSRAGRAAWARAAALVVVIAAGGAAAGGTMGASKFATRHFHRERFPGQELGAVAPGGSAARTEQGATRR